MSDRSARDGDETEQDWDEVRACHDESYLRWFGCGSKDPLGEKQEWGETRMPEGANYEQEQEILKTEVRGNMAISVVRESGCWRSDSGQVYVRWDHTQGEWKIIAAFFPEVTPALNPERRLRSYLSLIIFRMRLRSPTCNWYR